VLLGNIAIDPVPSKITPDVPAGMAIAFIPFAIRVFCKQSTVIGSRKAYLVNIDRDLYPTNISNIFFQL